MPQFRIIPQVLIQTGKAVKTLKFSQSKYVGDPVNICRILSELGADEIVISDIDVSARGDTINFDLLTRIANVTFCPLAYAGGIQDVIAAHKLIDIGFEKVIIRSSALLNPSLLSRIAETLGSQSVVLSLDVVSLDGSNYSVHVPKHLADSQTIYDMDPLSWARRAICEGVGEVFLQDVFRDGTQSGLSESMLQSFCGKFSVPVVVVGGMKDLSDAALAKSYGYSGIAGGSYFIFQGKNRAVLPSYPNELARTKFNLNS